MLARFENGTGPCVHFNSHIGVVAVGSGREAVEACAADEPSLVLPDLDMPDMDGWEAQRRLREQHPGLRVVIVTGTTDDQRVEETVAAGACAVVRKPCRGPELIELVSGILAGSSRPPPSSSILSA